MLIEHSKIKLRLGSLNFTWDDNKAELNERKHEIAFSAAACVFADTEAVVEFDSLDAKTDEERFHIIGMALQGLVFVVYVERVTVEGEDVLRIISARRAVKKEVNKYVYGIA